MKKEETEEKIIEYAGRRQLREILHYYLEVFGKKGERRVM